MRGNLSDVKDVLAKIVMNSRGLSFNGEAKEEAEVNVVSRTFACLLKLSISDEYIREIHK